MRVFSISTVLILFASASWAQMAFQEPIHLDKIWNGRWAYSADFDNDGKMDLLHSSTNEVVVLYNNGSHNFTTLTIQIAPGDLPIWELRFDVGDLNADGKADFVLSQQNRELPLLVFLSTGRAFTKIETQNVPDYINQLRISDLDKDGKADIVVAGATTSLYFFKGDGSGEFVMSQLEIFQSLFPFFISDLNNDGLNDIVGINQDSEMDVSLGSANGTFTHQTFALPAGSSQNRTLAIADFNGDNAPDLVATDVDITSTYTTYIYFNNGDATFAAPVSLPAPIIELLTTIDYDGDGDKDLVGMTIWSWLGVLENNGDGTFVSVQTLDKALPWPGWTSVADFDQDGDEELIVGPNGQQVGVQELHDGQLLYVEEQTFGSNPRKVLSADMNKDGLKDLVVGNAFSHTIEIFYGNAAQSYTIKKSFNLPSEFRDLAIGDLNSDGYADIAYACSEELSNSRAGILLSTPAGNYVPTTVVDGLGYVTVHALDFDSDGKTDLIFGNELYTNDGTGHFTSRTLIAPGNYIRATQDFDNDGFADVILNYGAEPKIAFNDGNGEFTDFSLLTDPGFIVIHVSIGYINDDQLPDIILGGQTDNAWERSPTRVLINKGNRQFDATDHSIYFGNNASIADFNLDGRNDILTVNDAKTYITLQDENGEFISAFEINDYNFYFDYSGADDMDSDGKVDFYTYNERGSLNVVFNDILPGPTLQPSQLTIQSLSDDEVTATFHKGNGTGRLLLLRQDIDSDEVPTDNVSYNYSSSFPSGATIGEGNHVVLTGDVTTLYISELQEGVEYELVAFEYAENNDKSKIDYNVEQPPSVRFTTKKKQTITFGDLSAVTFGANPIPIPVSASSGLPVTLTVSFGLATINGNNATPAQPGQLMLKASHPGNDEYMPAPNKEITFCVFPPVPTIAVNKDDPGHPILTSSATTNNQWQEEGTDIPGATNQTLQAEEDGFYSVKVSYAGCTRTSVRTALVITEVLKEESFRMFPNPVVNQLTITVPGLNDISSLTMLDMHGRRVSPAVVIRGNAADVDVDGLAEGIYLVQVACDGAVYQQKVLKTK